MFRSLVVARSLLDWCLFFNGLFFGSFFFRCLGSLLDRLLPFLARLGLLSFGISTIAGLDEIDSLKHPVSA